MATAQGFHCVVRKRYSLPFFKCLEVKMQTVRLSRQHQKILKMLHDGNSLKKNKQPSWYKNRYALSAFSRNS